MQPSFSGEDRPVSSARAGWKSIILLLNQNIKQMLLVGKKTNFLVGWKQCHFVWQSVFTYHLLKANLSRGTRCMTAVLPHGRPSAESVTLPCRKRPCGQIIVNVVRDFWPTRSYLVYDLQDPTWYMRRRISAFETASSFHSSGQLSKTYWAMSPALSLQELEVEFSRRQCDKWAKLRNYLGEKRYSLVFPLTRISRRFIWRK